MTIQYQKEADNIVRLTIDMPDRAVNVLNEAFAAAFDTAVNQLEADAALAGVILTSGKATFMAGADIDTMFNADDPAAYFEMAQAIKARLRRLETLGKPVVAALNGTALGGGLELALACHHRIALDDDRVQLGFPEVGLGLLPGGGGVARTVRLAGLQTGVEWLAQNKRYTPRQALAAGMIHAVAADAADLLAQARAWIHANPGAQAPWDAVRRYRIPGGDPRQPHVAQMLAIAPAMMRKETRGNYPAPHAILAAAVEGAQVDFETACRIESRYFASLAAGQVSKNMIRALWTQMNQVKNGRSRPAAVPPQHTTRVGVLGAGMMGHGIAYVSALAGLDVVMTDATQASADAGKERIAALMTKRVQRGRLTREEMEATLARITATADDARLAGCDLIIEAVFEDRALKAEVTARAEAVMDSTGIFASNTSTLPITGLAAASVRPEKFIGLHFFSPVHKMRLVEIILGEQTDRQTLAKAFDYVQTIRKVPIVVNDSRGFYTSRVFGTWTSEAMALLAEGNHPHAVEMAGLQAGMPVGPLALLDEISLSLVAHVREQTKADRAAANAPYRPHPGDVVLEKMLALGRTGRAGGAGFYAYDGRSKQLWPGLIDQFMDGQPQATQQQMIDRLLFIQAIETVRCLEEGVLRSVADANVGSILGWGFPPFHGGTLQFINAYGVSDFVRRARELAAAHGDRFAPPQRLNEMAASGSVF